MYKEPIIQIPPRLKDVLSKNADLSGPIEKNLNDFGRLFQHSKAVFFPEYTDHGPQHVQDVLTTASSLIRDEAWEIVTPEDVATLIVATILHDCGLHLGKEGFLALIDEENTIQLMDWCGDKPWYEVWQDFLSEASRFDGQKLLELFGTSRQFQRPLSDSSRWTALDHLLIGEFLRRNHARLAHEIAINGMPGPEKEKLKFENVSTEMLELSGLVARSHGISLRYSVDLLDARYNEIREYQGTHPIFLMTLLRVADFLQIQSERAPKQMLKIQTLKSPLSQREWNLHHAVMDVRYSHIDPEAVFIEARPTQVKTYLKLKKLLDEFQKELDSCWAVLGEVYGRWKNPNLDQLGLTIRRVRSNLDNDKVFSQSVDYIPCLANFQAADADLLKLLIHPLYGASPEFGVRELLQNAIDAVRELNEYKRTLPNAQTYDLEHQEADVVVSLEKETDDDWFLTVSDRGMGMTVDTVRNYFLKAGASFRRSDHWRKMFETDGKSRVLRAGRFGIGILSSFLIGNEIEVITRYVDEPRENGIRFDATIESSVIELMRVSAPIGTSIKIKLGPGPLSELKKPKKRSDVFGEYGKNDNWFVRSKWYCLDKPSVLFKSSEMKKKRGSVALVPAPKVRLPFNWRRIRHPKFEDIQYTYLDNIPALICNGLVISNKKRFNWSFDRTWYFDFDFEPPKLSVFDPNGELPINLIRDRLIADNVPFEFELLEDIKKDFAAYYLVNAPSSLESFRDTPSKLNYPGLSNVGLWMPKGRGLPSHFFVPNKGLSLASAWNVKHLKLRNILMIESYGLESAMDLDLVSHDAIYPIDFVAGAQDYNGLLRECLSMHLLGNTVIGGRILFRSKEKENIESSRAISEVFIGRLETELEMDQFVVQKFGNPRYKSFDFEKFVFATTRAGSHSSVPFVCEFSFIDSRDIKVDSSSYPTQAWIDYIKLAYIPFNLKMREQLLEKSFKKLKPYIKKWQKNKK